jgi:hypothetical protein
MELVKLVNSISVFTKYLEKLLKQLSVALNAHRAYRVLRLVLLHCSRSAVAGWAQPDN